MPKLITNNRSALLAIALAAVLAGCGSSAASPSSTSSSGSSSSSTASANANASGSSRAAVEVVAAHAVNVSISNYAFHPATLTVAAGTRITFTNHDQTAHTATASSGFDTGTVDPGKSGTVTFKKPGTYTYYCQFHAFMHGEVIVR
jgi:plastocyanin